jgi:chemotaxis protein MotA
MLVIIGIAAVFLAVLGGFLLERGNPYVLIQPAELLIILGSAGGIILVANPAQVIRKMGRGALATFRAPRRTRQVYLRNMRMLYEIFLFSQRAGMIELEEDCDRPENSRIFSNHPEFLADALTREFVCDSLRMLVLGVTAPHELDQLLDLDIEVQRRGRHEPVSALASIADALPGLGIVAAVLGIVVTMQAIGGAPELVGQKVAAALVGTFLGILLCYGVVGPIAARLENLSESETQFQQVLRIAIVGFAKGASPILAIEYARRSIPEELRPSFSEMEISVKRDARVPAVTRPGGAEATGAQAQPA